MQVIEKQINNSTIKILIISHKFKGFPNIVCSGSKLYQLPCQIGKKSFKLKELTPKNNNGSIVYLINSKRINKKLLKKSAYKVNEEFLLETIIDTPF